MDADAIEKTDSFYMVDVPSGKRHPRLAAGLPVRCKAYRAILRGFRWKQGKGQYFCGRLPQKDHCISGRCTGVIKAGKAVYIL